MCKIEVPLSVSSSLFSYLFIKVEYDLNQINARLNVCMTRFVRIFNTMLLIIKINLLNKKLYISHLLFFLVFWYRM